jgi:TolB protein
MTCLSIILYRCSKPLARIIYTAFILLPLLSSCGLFSASVPTPTASSTFTPVPPSQTPTASSTPSKPPTQTPYIITATPEIGATISAPQGTFFLSLADSGNFHLFAYSPQSLALTRLTDKAWDDITPAIGPDGKQLAFASNQNGYWDLYLLALSNGAIVRLTDTPEYDAAPSWSPDGAYITYESFQNGNLDILVRSVADSSQVYNLTQEFAADTSPVWSPRGRQIAFISNRSGDPEVWIADLDRSGDDRFINVSRSPQSVESHPAWSPDGDHLAWASTDPSSGLTGVSIWDARNPNPPARTIGFGDWPVWQDGDNFASRLTAPNQTFLAGYNIDGKINLPPLLMPGPVNGMAFGNTTAGLPGPFLDIAKITPVALYNSIITPLPSALPGHSSLAPLKGVQAPYPQLHELAVDSFQALRSQVARETGWDALASLENAYVPLTTPLEPGLGEDWLYAGRAFSINPALIQAGWMAIIREDFGQQTYWQMYLRTTAQDGSEGAPLTQVPWDFNARTKDPKAYENGGQLATAIPSGYWFDLTALAIQYGWERLPALTDWHTYYAGARFNELVFPQGLDWRTAMLQLYSPEFLVTPTVVIPPTRTPTRTPMWYRSPTPTSTPTFRPTNTP